MQINKKYRIAAALGFFILAGCSKSPKEGALTLNTELPEMKYDGMTNSMGIMRFVFPSQNGVEILYQSPQAGNRNNQLLVYLEQGNMEDPIILNSKPGNACSYAQPKNCSSYFDDGVNLHFYEYNGKLYYTWDDIDSETAKAVRHYMEADLDGENRKTMFSVTYGAGDPDEISPEFGSSFHYGNLFYVDPNDNTLKSYNLTNRFVSRVIEYENDDIPKAVYFDENSVFTWFAVHGSQVNVIMETDLNTGEETQRSVGKEPYYVSKDLLIYSDGQNVFLQNNDKEPVLLKEGGHTVLSGDNRILLSSLSPAEKELSLFDFQGNLLSEKTVQIEGMFPLYFTEDAIYTRKEWIPIINGQIQNPIPFNFK